MAVKGVLLVCVLTAIAWLAGFYINYTSAAVPTEGITSNPLIMTLGVFTLSMFVFGYGAPIAMFLVGLSNGITLKVNWQATLISVIAAWMSAYASIRLGSSVLEDIRGRSSLADSAKISSVIIIVALLIAAGVDIFPELGIPLTSTEIGPMPVTARIGALRDTFIDEGNPGTKYGSSEFLAIGTKGGKKITLLQFELPDGEIEGVRLYLYLRKYEGASSDRISAYVSESGFSEELTAWGPLNMDKRAIGRISPQPEIGGIEIPMDELREYAGKRVSLIFETDSGGEWAKYFGSRESVMKEMQPKLIVTYFE